MPTALNTKTFRQAMGMFATGVTVLATEQEGKIHAMTANAFSSLSLDPPLILVCLQRGTKMEGYLSVGQPFSVNFLTTNQEQLSSHFAGGLKDGFIPKFSFSTFASTVRLDESMCSIACAVEELVDGGDHVVVFGRVADIEMATDADPLLFFHGRYRSLASQL